MTFSFFLIKSIKHKSTLSFAYDPSVYLGFYSKKMREEKKKKKKNASVFKPIKDMHCRRRQWI